MSELNEIGDMSELNEIGGPVYKMPLNLHRIRQSHFGVVGLQKELIGNPQAIAKRQQDHIIVTAQDAP